MAVSKKEKEVKAVPKTAHRYFEGVGRRKTATARVRIAKGDAPAMVNGKELTAYFQVPRLAATALQPIASLNLGDTFSVTAHVTGGGIEAQAEAVRHGLARALVLFDETLKQRLRVEGFMTRDPRMVERKKYGLKKARRAPQWAKR